MLARRGFIRSAAAGLIGLVAVGDVGAPVLSRWRRANNPALMRVVDTTPGVCAHCGFKVDVRQQDSVTVHKVTFNEGPFRRERGWVESTSWFHEHCWYGDGFRRSGMRDAPPGPW